MYIWVRHSRSTKVNEHHIGLDIDLINSKGNVCISLKSLLFNEENTEQNGKANASEFEQYLASFYDLVPNGSSVKSSENINEEFQRLLGNDFSNRN